MQARLALRHLRFLLKAPFKGPQPAHSKSERFCKAWEGSVRACALTLAPKAGADVLAASAGAEAALAP